jgi:hypothetical protein
LPHDESGEEGEHLVVLCQGVAQVRDHALGMRVEHGLGDVFDLHFHL